MSSDPPARLNGVTAGSGKDGPGSPSVGADGHRRRRLRPRRARAAMLALIPDSQLAVLPGTSHMTATRSLDLLLPVLEAFLH